MNKEEIKEELLNNDSFINKLKTLSIINVLCNLVVKNNWITREELDTSCEVSFDNLLEEALNDIMKEN